MSIIEVILLMVATNCLLYPLFLFLGWLLRDIALMKHGEKTTNKCPHDYDDWDECPDCRH